MLERLIQTIKRRLSVLNTDPKWSKIKLADKIAEIIQEKKRIPTQQQKYHHSLHTSAENTKHRYQTSLLKLQQKTYHTTI